MPIEERRARYAALMSRLEQYDVHAWREDFLNALQRWGRAPPRTLKWEPYERVA
jgi:trehalose-6-phosphate synthase